MLQKLKQKSLKSALWYIAVELAVGVGLLAWGFTALLALVRGPVPLDQLAPDQLEGAYVEMDVDTLIDSYAETVESSSSKPDRTTFREYLLPLEDAVIGVELPSSMLDDADAVVEDTFRWMTDMDGSYVWDGSHITVRGTIREMDEETQGYYYETLGYYLDESDMEGYCLPLVLKQNALGNLDPNMHGLVLGGAAVFLALGLGSLALQLSGSGQRSIKAYVAAHGAPDALWPELDAFYESTPTEGGLKMDRRWLLYDAGSGAFLLAGDDVTWIYHTVTTHRRNFVVTGKSHTVTVCSRSETGSRARHTIPVASEDAANTLMANMYRWYPDAAYGYKPEWDRAFRKDPAGFYRDRQAARRAAMAAAQAAGGAPAPDVPGTEPPLRPEAPASPDNAHPLY